MDISQSQMNNLFSYLNARSSVNVPNTELNKQRMNNLVFGEELTGYIPNVVENRHAEYEANKMSSVRGIAHSITSRMYDGEPKFTNQIVGIYQDLTDSRKLQGVLGIRGKNMKGVLCAILVLLLLYEQGTSINMNKLVNSANSVKSSALGKVSSKMIYRYIPFVIDNLVKFHGQNDTNNRTVNDDTLVDVKRELKQIALSFGMSTREVLRDFKQDFARVDSDILVYHTPRTVAAGLFYMKHLNVFNGTPDALRQRIGVSVYALKKVLTRLKKVSIPIH